MPDSNKTLLLVLGMHRSGTSMLSHICSKLGADLGKNIMQPADDNVSGFWENQSLVDLHDKILHRLGASWYYPEIPEENWHKRDDIQEIRKEILDVLDKEYSDSRLICIKDPRQCLLLPLWKDIARNRGWDIKCIHISRNPLEVAASLKIRNDISLSDSIFLWLIYNLYVLRHSADLDICFVTFEQLLDDWKKYVLSAWQKLSIKPPDIDDETDKAISNIINLKLRHHAASIEELESENDFPLIVSRLYRFFSSAGCHLSGTASLEQAKRKRFISGDQSLIREVISVLENAITHSTGITAVKYDLDKLIEIDDRRFSLKPFLSKSVGGLKILTYKIAKYIYHRAPIHTYYKYRIKDFFYENLAFVFRKTLSYRAWKENKDFLRSRPDKLIKSANKYHDTEIVFYGTDYPDVSIIIPVFNNIDFTLSCLRSICANRPAASIEVIVIDDCSTDDTAEKLQGIPGLRYARNNKNSGFVFSCNHGASLAKGRYLHFLNNDTEVHVGWLDKLLEIYISHPGTGLVGSKLIYPNMTIQEAGGIIWNNATGWNYGRRRKPDDPACNYVREVDYCSGASILIEKSLFEKVGQFSREFMPAYYEDTDLAFKVREEGLRVMYQPFSSVTHYEGITSGNDITTGVKSYQVRNRDKFYKKWRGVLAQHHPPGFDPDKAKDRLQEKFVLYVDTETPTPDRDSGSVDAFNMMSLLCKSGHHVTFAPEDNMLFMNGYTPQLQAAGVECLFAPYQKSLSTYLKENVDRYDAVILSRLNSARKYLDLVKTINPECKIIFNTVDLHFLRETRQAEIEDNDELRKISHNTRKQELDAISRSDLTLLISKEEFSLIQELLPDAKLFHFPLIIDISNKLEVPFNDRRDILFIGSFQHPPNVDAINYFLDEIWPRVKQKLPDIRFHIIGETPPESLRNFDDDSVIVHGYLKDISPFFNQSLATIAPLRYGAGIKGKIGRSLGYGVPCVATDIAVEGMLLEDNRNILVADSPEDFADKIHLICTDNEWWEAISKHSLQFFEENYSLNAAQKRIDIFINSLSIHD